jgi:hypothetical protein
MARDLQYISLTKNFWCGYTSPGHSQLLIVARNTVLGDFVPLAYEYGLRFFLQTYEYGLRLFL